MLNISTQLGAQGTAVKEAASLFFFWMLKALFSCEGSCIVVFFAAPDTLAQHETRIKGQNFIDVASDLMIYETRVPRESLIQLNLQTKFTFCCTSLSPVKLHW